eukprot:scaffold284635_cov30-Tisochrysis_lutea.AAC.1
MKGHGNAAADALRAQMGQREREAMFAASERERERIRAETAAYRVGATNEKFASTISASESQLAQATVGLVSKEEFARRRKALEAAQDGSSVEQDNISTDGKVSTTREKKKKKEKLGTLSFAFDDEDGEECEPELKRAPKKAKKKALPTDSQTEESARRETGSDVNLRAGEKQPAIAGDKLSEETSRST